MPTPLPDSGGEGMPYHIISAIMADEEADTLDTDLPTLQKEDPELAEIIKFLETGVLRIPREPRDWH